MAKVPLSSDGDRSIISYNNSLAARNSLNDNSESERPQLERVVVGKVSQKKKTPGQRFSETFLNNGDVKSIGSTILLDVIVPAFKEMLFNSIRDGFSMLLWGDTRASKSTTRNGSIIRDYTSYSNYSYSSRPRQESIVSDESPKYNNLIFERRADAEDVVYHLRDSLNRYDSVTIMNLYELVGIGTNPQHNKWGWTDLTNIRIRHVRDGFLLELPPPIYLE